MTKLDLAGGQQSGRGVAQTVASPAPFRSADRVRPSGRGWAVPVVTAAALLGATVVVVVVAWQDGAHAPAASSPGAGAASTGSILGLWRLVGATAGHPVRVPAEPGFTVTFRGDGSAVILTGVNAITLSVQYGQGAVTARFRLTTAALDGSSDPNRLAVLALFDSLAPSAAPAPPARSTYRVQGDQLSVRVPAGTLDFTRIPTGPAGSGSTSSSPAAPIGQPS